MPTSTSGMKPATTYVGVGGGDPGERLAVGPRAASSHARSSRSKEGIRVSNDVARRGAERCSRGEHLLDRDHRLLVRVAGMENAFGPDGGRSPLTATWGPARTAREYDARAPLRLSRCRRSSSCVPRSLRLLATTELASRSPLDSRHGTLCGCAVTEMRLYDVRVTVERMREGCSGLHSRSRQLVRGDQDGAACAIPHRFAVAPSSRSISDTAPPRESADVLCPDEDWLKQDNLVCCPDPDERLVMRIQRSG